MGRGTHASGTYSVASGRLSKAEGDFSTAMGFNTTAQSYGEVVVGQYNQLSHSRFADSPSVKAWSRHDAAFRVGVGTSADDRKDALTVFKDGRVCTAQGMVSRCGEEQFAAEARRAREAALPGEVDELKGKVAAIMGKGTQASGSHAVASGEGSAWQSQ